jgi:hypothetical protein
MLPVWVDHDRVGSPTGNRCMVAGGAKSSWVGQLLACLGSLEHGRAAQGILDIRAGPGHQHHLHHVCRALGAGEVQRGAACAPRGRAQLSIMSQATPAGMTNGEPPCSMQHPPS